MSIKKFSALAIAGLMTLGVVAAVAQDAFVPPATAEEALAARKALMREDGALLRSAGNLSGAEAVAAMQTLLDNYTHIPDLFPEGSIVGDSEALPAIWENWEDFVAIVETGKQAATDGLAAAEAGDATAYAAAVQALGATCGACHQQFRG
ncbi:MAG: cytochrome c [Alphaproteobacteria bacterium]|jgi:cytochrome c556|nr:cytochrome c [Alphaproteobacteria bacterium]MBU1563288.1 cytochrome c [Alphaproteobacteria bacterium]MBU2303311.1 cytochrome c [Alphaproteobacteria bacterium]MBU2368559.1 cytochrome c [Alphaproteobacteria bacterium]